VIHSDSDAFWIRRKVKSGPKKDEKVLEVVSIDTPEFAQDHKSGLRSDRGPVVLCDFSKL
jgi:hypothetical protein